MKQKSSVKCGSLEQPIVVIAHSNSHRYKIIEKQNVLPKLCEIAANCGRG